MWKTVTLNQGLLIPFLGPHSNPFKVPIDRFASQIPQIAKNTNISWLFESAVEV